MSTNRPARSRRPEAQRHRQCEAPEAVYGDRVSAIDIGPVLPGINAMALPGHTPGHTGFLVHDDRRSLLVWADIVHLDALQLADPDIGLTTTSTPPQLSTAGKWRSNPPPAKAGMSPAATSPESTMSCARQAAMHSRKKTAAEVHKPIPIL